jgi:hypothetical protein
MTGADPPTIVTKVYSIRPKMRKILVILIQNSASPKNLTEKRFNTPMATRQAEIRIAGWRGSQYSTMTFMAVSSKQIKAHWVMIYCVGQLSASKECGHIELTFQPRAMAKLLSTNRSANEMNPPSNGSRVVISIRQLEAQKTTKAHMITPSRSPRGPAEVRGPPIDTKRAAPIDPEIAISWTCRIRRPLNRPQQV